MGYRIPKTGTYLDRVGNGWWFREGHELADDEADGLRYVGDGAKEGAPENRAVPAAPEQRAEAPAPRSGKGKGQD